MTTTIEQQRPRIIWSAIAEPGDQAASKLITAAGGPEHALELIRTRTVATVIDTPEMTEGVERWSPRLEHATQNIDRIIHQLEQNSITALTPEDDRWPAALNKLGVHAPVILYTRGNTALLNTGRRAAVVGARANTLSGEHSTQAIVRTLTSHDVTIVGGGSYGIDAIAHREALALGKPTIMVSASGLDVRYPAGNFDLIRRIEETGAVISELPPVSQPTKWRFLQRNRIVAALSDTVIVTEAGWRSGSLNIAAHANALGIPVGAVPGPLEAVASAGCLRLIEETGATPIVTSEDAWELVRGSNT